MKVYPFCTTLVPHAKGLVQCGEPIAVQTGIWEGHEFVFIENLCSGHSAGLITSGLGACPTIKPFVFPYLPA